MIIIISILILLAGFKNDVKPGVTGGMYKGNASVSFQSDVLPIMKANCAVSNCHDGTMPPFFGNYRNISNYADRIKFRLGYVKNPMPPIYAEKKISDEDKQKLLQWIDAGSPEN